MSRRGGCWVNTVAESFFSSLRKERIKMRIYKDRGMATRDIADYIAPSTIPPVATAIWVALALLRMNRPTSVGEQVSSNLGNST